jgi:hypothetical protein
MAHQLREDELALMHRATPRREPQHVARTPLEVQIETNHKTYFYQSVQ